MAVIEKKEKIFLAVCAIYVIVAECLLTYCKTPLCYYEVTIGGIICLLMFAKSKKLFMGIREILLAGTVISYCVIMEYKDLFSSDHPTFHAALVWLTYIYMTKFLMSEAIERNMAEKMMWGIIIVLTVGFTIHAVVDTGLFLSIKDFSSLESMISYSVKANGYGIRGDCWKDFFNNIIIPRTHLNYFLIPIFACTLPAWFSEIKPQYKIVIVLMDVFSLLGIMCSGMGRGPFVIFFFIILVQLFILNVFNQEHMSKFDLKKKFMVVTALFLLIMGFSAFCFASDEFRQTLLLYLKRNGGIIHNIRLKWQLEVIKNIPKYPFGVPSHNPNDVYGFYSAHNVWLDMVLYAGLIPFISFVLYTLFTLKDLFLFIKGKASFLLKLTIGGWYVGYVVSYAMNPAFDASIEFIAPWLMINSMIYTYNGSNKEQMRFSIHGKEIKHI